MGDTMAREDPVSTFSSVLLPTFGRPIIAIEVSCCWNSPCVRWRGLPCSASSASGVFDPLRCRKGQRGEYLVEQLADADSMLRGNREDFADTQAAILRSLFFHAFGVDLVHCQQQGLPPRKSIRARS